MSNSTKISARMLRALEEEHFEQLPGGVFTKGFVRAYARQVGLNEEETVADYLAALRENQLEGQRLLPDLRAPGSQSSGRALKTPAAIASGNRSFNGDQTSGIDDPFVSFDPHSAEIGDKFRRHDGPPLIAESITQRASQSFVPPPNSKSPILPRVRAASSFPWTKFVLVALFVAALLYLWNSHRHAISGAVRAERGGKAVTAPFQPAQQSIPSASVPVPHKNSLQPNVTKVQPYKPAVVHHQTVVSVKRSHAEAVKKPLLKISPARKTLIKKSPSFIVVIRAAKTTSVSIIADGKLVTRETLIAPAHTSVRATRQIVVKVGDAAAVSFVVNGKVISGQGSDGEARTYAFDAHGEVAVAVQVPTPVTNR